MNLFLINLNIIFIFVVNKLPDILIDNRFTYIRCINSYELNVKLKLSKIKF